MERKEGTEGLAAAGDFAKQERGNTETGPRRDLRVIGQTATEAEIARGVHSVDEIQPHPPLIDSHLDDVPTLGPGQTIGNLDRMLAAVPPGETTPGRSNREHPVDLNRGKSVLREDRGKTKFARPLLVEAGVGEDQVLPGGVRAKFVQYCR